jgi:hypothetical protein
VADVASKPTPAWYVDYALNEARRGEPGHLIARLQNALQGGERLSDGEYWFIIEALEATESKQTRAQLRDLEKQLIALQVDGLIDEEGMKPKQAVEAVKKDRDCSTRHIRTALRAYGKPRRYRA